MTKVELYAIGTSTILASNKSLRRNGYALAGTERHENGGPSLRYSVPVPFG